MPKRYLNIILKRDLLKGVAMTEDTKEIQIKILEEAIAKEALPAEKSMLLSKLSTLVSENSAEKAVEYAHRAVQEAEKSGDLNLFAVSHAALGIAYGQSADYSKALKVFEEVFEIAKKTGDKGIIARSHNNKGVIYTKIGDYTKASTAFLEALRINEELGNDELVATNLNNLGDIYLLEGAFDKAIEYYRKAIELKEKLQNNHSLAVSLNGLASALNRNGRYDEATDALYRAYEIFHSEGNPAGMATVLANIGSIRKAKGDFQNAKETFMKSLSIMEEIGDKWGIAGNNINIASIELETDNITGAKLFAEQGLQIAEQIGAQTITRAAYSILSRVYEKDGDFQRALQCFKHSKEINEKILNIETTRKIERLEAKYDLEKKEREMEIYRKASITDTLTGLLNRPGIIEKLQDADRAFRSEGTEFSIAIADIDHFKRFNDTYGHACGDIVLKKVAESLLNAVSEEGFVGRWGGEEFIILLPNSNLEEAYVVAERARISIEAETQSFNGKVIQVTMSFGVACIKDTHDIDKCTILADTALYKSKKLGRNRVESSIG